MSARKKEPVVSPAAGGVGSPAANGLGEAVRVSPPRAGVSPSTTPPPPAAGLPSPVAKTLALPNSDGEADDPDTLTKRKLVVAIAKDLEEEATHAGRAVLTQMEVLSVVQRVLDHVYQALVRGEKVELRNFGVFEVKSRKARVGRNPNVPNADVTIPTRAVVKFKPGKEMRQDVLAITAAVLEREAVRLKHKTSKRGRRRRRRATASTAAGAAALSAKPAPA